MVPSWHFGPPFRPSSHSYKFGMHDCLVAALGNYTYGAFAVVTVGKPFLETVALALHAGKNMDTT